MKRLEKEDENERERKTEREIERSWQLKTFSIPFVVAVALDIFSMI